ncbi:hypothetical protein VQ056_05320 [Paenibacillus sp. JTLBN-2024]
MSPQKHHTSLIHSIVRQALEIKKLRCRGAGRSAPASAWACPR